MADVRLIPIDPATEAALHADPAFGEAMANDDWGLLADVVRKHLGPLLDADGAETQAAERVRSGDWSGYAAVDPATGSIVGQCGFKGPPDPDGAVEIAYFTNPGFEGRGCATAMAEQLVTLAQQSPAVRTVIAHTLPEPNASTRVLEKAGLNCVGEVTDPEDGRVWRWKLRVHA